MSMTNTSEESSSGSSGDGVGVFPDIRREDIDVGPSLGVGTYGAVFSGTWHPWANANRVVALKKVFVLAKEAEILSKIRHKNIIQFYGVCKSENDFLIVTECAENGSLYDHIHKKENQQHDAFDQVLKWALEIARGVHYLHYDAVTTIIHRDLKSKNVVLDHNFVCKICDFGTSKDLTHSFTAPTWGGTAAWMSPEMILQTEGITTATDVWSYGVVLWEILSREVPYKDYTEYRIYSLITQSGVTLAIPDSCPPQLSQLLHSCWKMQPKDRLTMKQILKTLTTMEENPKIHEACAKSLNADDWKAEIRKQKQDVEKMKQDLDKRREKLENRERAFELRIKLNNAAIESATHLPEDTRQWNEHNTAAWIGGILSRVGLDGHALTRIKSTVFRNRITGNRLLEISQNDLERLGVHKLGSRIEVMKAIQKLKSNQHTLHNFPTLEQARNIELAKRSVSKEVPAARIGNIHIVLILGVYQRPCANGRSRFKFFVDSDWDDDYMESTPPRKVHEFVKSACFCVIDDVKGKPLNEPSFAVSTSSGCCAMEDWVTTDENIKSVNLIANVQFSDNINQPRNTEFRLHITDFQATRTLEIRKIELKLRRSSTSTTSPISPNPGMLQTVSYPQLRGAWHRKATLGRQNLTENELVSVHEALRAPVIEEIRNDSATVANEHVPGRRKKTISEGESTSAKERKKNKGKPSVHGGKDKWSWDKRARPKFL
ncbi:unnamed protein product [Caenorhabditis auriculariae]|uniref:Uncharacterized protein n=1 Tax=Caenorhabditis auriculariae TaxID=2777116 RepID=A0A8S1GQL5_9PELO|nr:unnamed protein product [Caenorhabditis auriculariae]